MSIASVDINVNRKIRTLSRSLPFERLLAGLGPQEADLYREEKAEVITQLTSKEVDPLRRAEAILIEAKDMQQLLDGRASVGPRILPFSIDNTEEEKEKALQPKIQSKMQVSTFLAGFSFTALIGILTQDGFWQDSASTVSRAAAAASLICLTWASALFVAAVYMFDRLAMPRKFWSEEHVKTPKRGADFNKDSTEHGRVYAHMIWTWKYVFSSAVLFAVLGFAALVFHRGIPLLTIVLLVGLVAVFACYLTTRPQSGGRLTVLLGLRCP